MMRKRIGLAFVLAVVLAVPAALAQAPEKAAEKAVPKAPDSAPSPGPEHKKLGYFVGTWTGEGIMKPNPFMPAGTYTSGDECKWFEGGFAVVCHSRGKGPMGDMKGLGIMSYSPEEKIYTYYGVDSSGMTMTTVSKGSVQGSTWTFTDESLMGGKMVKSRYVITELSPASYSFKWEMLGEDGTWVSVVEGKQSKAK